MREIKFRMWDFENEQMIDGDSLAFEEYAPISHLLSQKGIMQYTGLKDKNGKEIYEGDILNYCGNDKGTVEWRNERCCFSCMSANNGAYLWLIEELPVEIIGNIYANPELLEVTP